MWRHFKVRTNLYFYDTVVYTHWGPVTYDEKYHAENNLKSLCLPLDFPRCVRMSFLPFTNSIGEKITPTTWTALDYYASPGQNFVFASVSGDIAMRVQGKYPARRKDEGKFVLDGSEKFQWMAGFYSQRTKCDGQKSGSWICKFCQSISR